MNPYLKRLEKKGSNGHGKISEKQALKSIGARTNPNSGAVQGAKGDGVRKGKKRSLRIEAKSTIHNTMSVELGWLVKITTEARATGSEPILTLSFVTPDGKVRPLGDWVAMPRSLAAEVFDELLG